MTTSSVSHESAPDLATEAGLQQVLATIDRMAAQRPAAARIVAATNSEDVSARELSRMLASDVALAGRVMKLANSATFGMRGRVESLQFAVTVVGFTTVRTMATLAMTHEDGTSSLPEEFWTTTAHLAITAASVAPNLGTRSQDGLCIGLLAELGAALLHHNDPDGYGPILRDSATSSTRRATERRRYGLSAIELSAIALDRWSFPQAVIEPMQKVDALGSAEGAVLRVGYEVAARLADPDRTQQSIVRLSCGRLEEKAMPQLLQHVREEADALHRTIVGD